MKTAFVFSGGASLGALEVGMLKALTEYDEEIKADFVIGTSVGSLNGAFYAYNPTAAGVVQLEAIWDEVTFKNVFSPSPITPVKNLLTFGKYLISPKNLRNLLQKHLPYEKFEETKIPFYAVTTDLKTGREVVFNRGLVLEALMGSVAIPMVFPPSYMENFMLFDGGVVNNSPISTAVKLGAERVIVFPIGYLNTPEAYPKNLEEVVVRALLYLLTRQLTSDYHLYKDKVDLRIMPSPPGLKLNPIDFSHSAELIQAAYVHTQKWLKNGGWESKLPLESFPCDVYSEDVFLCEAVEPFEDKPAKERIKENLEDVTCAVKETVEETVDKMKESYSKSKAHFKEKLEQSKGKILHREKTKRDAEQQ
ncbi:MAG: patatin-like phospholipase family protein [Promethearchaeota archaeon]